MVKHTIVAAFCCSLALVVAGCSRQQSDWQKTRESNTADAYEQFLKKYPSGEFTAQAQARVKELYEERDWQKARDADTPEAYQAFLKQYPDGKWTEEARIRVENFTLAQAPSGPASTLSGGPDRGAAAASPPPAPQVVPPVPKAAPRTASAAGAPPAPRSAVKPVHASRSPATGGAGPYAVQLGAFKSGAGAAKHRWTHLQRQYPTLLAGLSSKVLTKKTAAGSLYRLQAVGLTEKHAHDVCSALRARSQPCIVVPPTPG